VLVALARFREQAKLFQIKQIHSRGLVRHAGTRCPRTVRGRPQGRTQFCSVFRNGTYCHGIIPQVSAGSHFDGRGWAGAAQ